MPVWVVYQLLFIPTDSTIAVCHPDSQYIPTAIQFLQVFNSIRRYCVIISEDLARKIQNNTFEFGLWTIQNITDIIRLFIWSKN